MICLSYMERLKSLKLFSIKGRPLWSDLFNYWKILWCDSARYELSVLFQRSLEERTWGHNLKLIMAHYYTDVK